MYTGETVSTDDNFYELLRVALIIDCLHLIDFDSIVLFGHTNIMTLDAQERSSLYLKSRPKIIREALRADKADVLRRCLL